jgi:hypothetical protein
MKTLIFEGVFHPQDAANNPYVLLPFIVPPGAKTIKIRYFYDKDEENIIDLGLFDPRGNEFLQGRGFRGWSGSAKESVIVSETWATPGYLPGPIYVGTWHVILGLYKIGRPCHYYVEVSLLEEEIKSSLALDFSVHPPKSSKGWQKGDLHCHTIHSDAFGTVAEVWAAAQRRGLDFLAITDHNTISHFSEIKELNRLGGIVIPGEEITTYHGHANVWGLWEWTEFRCTSSEEIKKVCTAVHAKGGLFSINHPKRGGPEWEFSYDINADCMEVWQSFWQLNNIQSLGVWHSLLRQRRRVVAVGGSDAHPRLLKGRRMIEWLGFPTTWVRVEKPDAEGVLEGIRRGHVSISACPHGPFLEVNFLSGENVFYQGDVVTLPWGKLRVHTQGGAGLEVWLFSQKGYFTKRRVEGDDWVWEEEIDLAHHGYVGAELRVRLASENFEMAAIANPIWYEPWLERKKEE